MLLAVLLVTMRSLTLALQVSVIVASSSMLIFQLAVPDPVAFWQPYLDLMVTGNPRKRAAAGYSVANCRSYDGFGGTGILDALYGRVALLAMGSIRGWPAKRRIMGVSRFEFWARYRVSHWLLRHCWRW